MRHPTRSDPLRLRLPRPRLAALPALLLTFPMLHMACACPEILRDRPDSALTIAAAAGDAEAVSTLISRGEPIDAPDGNGMTPLMWAAFEGRTQAVEILLRAGADPDARARNRRAWTALMHALHKDHDAAALLLMESRADLNAGAPNGLTPLMVAAGEGNLEMVTALLARGADPYAEQLDHLTALTGAVSSGNAKVVRALLLKAPELRLHDTIEDTVALWSAKLRGDREIAALVQGAAR